MRFLSLILSILLFAACDSNYNPLPRSGDAWKISGIVVNGETDEPIPNQMVNIHRFQKKTRLCVDCSITAVEFNVITNADGRFYLSGQLPGDWGIMVSAPSKGLCSYSIGLGFLVSQEQEMVLELGSEPCPLVL